MTALSIHPLTPDRWDDFAGLMETDSICRMCWCVHHRLPADIRKETPRDARKGAMRAIVRKGPPPGLLAYRANEAGEFEAVGWLAIAPRPETPDWNTGRKASAALEPEDALDPATWGASCFFVRKDARGEGVTAALLDAGIAHARSEGAKQIDACPMAHDDKRSVTGLFVGPKRVFDRAGFRTLIERKPGRPLMRLDITPSKAKKAGAKASRPPTRAARKDSSR